MSSGPLPYTQSLVSDTFNSLVLHPLPVSRPNHWTRPCGINAHTHTHKAVTRTDVERERERELARLVCVLVTLAAVFLPPAKSSPLIGGQAVIDCLRSIIKLSQLCPLRSFVCPLTTLPESAHTTSLPSISVKLDIVPKYMMNEALVLVSLCVCLSLENVTVSL